MAFQERFKVVGLIALIVTVAIGLAFVIHENNLRGLSFSPRGTPSPTLTLTPPKPSPVTTPIPSTTVLEDETKSIRVTNMVSGQRLLNGFIVQGTAVAFESRFSWRLLDSHKRMMSSGSVSSRQPDAGVPGPFAFPALFTAVPKTATGTLMVYEASARDGSDIHVVNIPVTFSTSTIVVDVYFGNTKKNPTMLDCSLVYPVRRTVPDGVLPFISINALLQGPTTAEKTKGYVTNIPKGTVIENAVDAKGDPSIDFSETLRQGVAGSCLVTAIRSQIDHTVAQNATTTTETPISISGVVDDVLQP